MKLLSDCCCRPVDGADGRRSLDRLERRAVANEDNLCET